MATKKNLTEEIRRYEQAQVLLTLGARVPVVFELTRLSSWFLRKLAREVCGRPPRKGQVPSSELWYLRSRNNLQASMFMALHLNAERLADGTADPVDLLVTVFRQYRETLEQCGLEPVLTMDRAWWLLKSLRIRTLKLIRCESCGGDYVRHFGDLSRGFQCDCCRGAVARTEPHRQAA